MESIADTKDTTETLNSKKTDIKFPLRPQPSANFKPKIVELTSNHYKIVVHNPKILIKLYSIDTEPSIPTDSRRDFKSIVSSAREDIKKFLKSEFIISGRVLFSLGGSEDQKIFSAIHNSKTYAIKLQKVRETSLSAEVFKDNTTASATRQYINIVVKKAMRDLKLTEWGMNY